MSDNKDNIASFFHDLDAAFVNFEPTHDSLHWNSTDCTINYEQWSLPIPVSMSGSVVAYSFSTRNGDIDFGVKFYTPEGVESVLLAAARVPSDQEAICGSFKAPHDGTIKFTWDNTFSWLTPKELSYSIELHQPSFPVADNTRCGRARSLLHAVVEDSRLAERQLAASAARIQAMNDELLALTAKIRALQDERDEKLLLQTTAEGQTAELRKQIMENNQKKLGLCMRCLDRKLTTKVLSYFDGNALEVKTCKYWMALHSEAPRLVNSNGLQVMVED
mmetsp:Transcript_34632/g.35322  ORF Transcript_34632/g.35322 Transcript_34632/m.35322 type:complete len:276 (-) Transcript_34632:26-853(-)|eukprot:CAMPEP_0182428468 /NCGR_PEP_ID=MMETSP1167-20130531/23050_1 /TAXON_ID=2988 /ORGANISM="Mallomonas Sp, Strain CCMP3275" /LENGTH=275 /DNA_ID=CAMNT_0024611403 /DNA_START=79 /DNA_END=906 /DNA_ORIENTATION=+